MSKYKFILLAFLSLFMATAQAEENSAFPSDLMFGDKPIDALCFAEWEDSKGAIFLNECGITKLNYTPTGQSDRLLGKGFIGFNWQDPKNQVQGFSYYKIFPAGKRLYWVYTLNNGGGSGLFSTINLIKRKNDMLKIEEIADGDRCNGGIQDVSENKHHLTFSTNLTAFDFLELAHNNSHHLKAYQDLAACATCCSARAFYEVDTDSDPVLQYVDIAQHGNRTTMPDQGLYQDCFNRLIASHVAKGELKMAPDKFKAFVDEFNQTCIR